MAGSTGQQDFFGTLSILRLLVRRVSGGQCFGSPRKDKSMRFMCLYKPAKQEGVRPTEHEMAEMGKLIDEMFKAGVLLATEGCQPSSKGARVRLAGGTFSVTDGPFIETKELIAGFALIQVKSKEEAIAWTKRFLEVAGDGESEIRLLHEAADFAPCESKGHERDSREQLART
jgi:hypothetical protein